MLPPLTLKLFSAPLLMPSGKDLQNCSLATNIVST